MELPTVVNVDSLEQPTPVETPPADGQAPKKEENAGPNKDWLEDIKKQKETTEEYKKAVNGEQDPPKSGEGGSQPKATAA